MAGIGFTLKRLFDDEMLYKNTSGYLYSSFVVAGPWIITVIIFNILIFISNYYDLKYIERQFFMGTIIYCFVFSQIITSPFQLLISRYISDKLYDKDYKTISASFKGLSFIVLLICITVSVIFYLNKPIPIYFITMSISLFCVISLIWIIMVYLSAIKNYSIISKAYVTGGIVSISLALLTVYYPVSFNVYPDASNLLLSYLFGMCITFIILLFSFIKSFPYHNRLFFDFIRCFGNIFSISLIGILYTLGLWSHNIIMWLFSDISEVILNVYSFSPIYDYASFLAFFITIPTSIMFVVTVETDFYAYYRKFFGLIINNGTLEQLKIAKEEMKRSLLHNLFFVFETQAIISITAIAMSSWIFVLLNESYLVRNVFRILALGAFFEIFVFLIILILLYLQANRQGLIVASSFCILNILFTYFLLPLGFDYYGIGFFITSFISLIIGVILTIRYINNLEKNTFLKQNINNEVKDNVFSRIANSINRFTEGE